MEAEVETVVIVLSSNMSKLRICLQLVTQAHTARFPQAAQCAHRNWATARCILCK